MTPWNHGKFFFAQKFSTIKSLSNNTKARFSDSVAEILCECIPLTEMLLSLKVAKKYVPVYCFHGKHFTCWDLRGVLETDKYSKQTLHESSVARFPSNKFARAHADY